MKTTVGELRRLILKELGSPITRDFGHALEQIQQDMQGLIKQTEHAHELAPQGPAKAIVAGIHSDLFNQAAEIRKYVDRLKAMARVASGQSYR